MNDKNNYLYMENTEILQIPYKEYVALLKKAKENQRCQEIKQQVLADLVGVLGDRSVARSKEVHLQNQKPAKTTPEPSAKKPEPSIKKPEPSAKKPEPSIKKPEPEAKKQVDKKAEKGSVAPAATMAKQSKVDLPPIKKDIAEYFNKVDGSGRLFNVFKQYYTCVNESCGGTVRVTIKDGICSFWNYDQWEEFTFVDVFDGRLRIGVASCYTEQLKTLDLCEVPRLLASRYSLVCVQVDNLNQIMLDTLVTAFNEVGVNMGKAGAGK